MKIVDLQKKGFVPKLKLFLYGHPDSGKTYFALNHKLKTLYMTTELSSAETTINKMPKTNKDSQIYPITDFASLKAKIELLQEKCDYDLVVIDSLTDIQNVVTKSLPAGFRDGEIPTGWDGWRKWKNTLIKWMGKEFVKIPAHCIMIAHAKEFSSNDERHMEPTLYANDTAGPITKEYNLSGAMITFEGAETKEDKRKLDRGIIFYSKKHRYLKKGAFKKHYKNIDLMDLINELKGEN